MPPRGNEGATSPIFLPLPFPSFPFPSIFLKHFIPRAFVLFHFRFAVEEEQVNYFLVISNEIVYKWG